MSSRLASRLVQGKLLSSQQLAEAFERQVIYEGNLDTVLLEQDLVDEGTLLEQLGAATGLPVWRGPIVDAARDREALVQLVPAALAEEYRVVPLGLDEARRQLLVLVGDPPGGNLTELGAKVGRALAPQVTTEVLLEEARSAVYGDLLPSRFANLRRRLGPTPPAPKPRPATSKPPSAAPASTPAAASPPPRLTPLAAAPPTVGTKPPPRSVTTPVAPPPTAPKTPPPPTVAAPSAAPRIDAPTGGPPAPSTSGAPPTAAPVAPSAKPAPPSAELGAPMVPATAATHPLAPPEAAAATVAQPSSAPMEPTISAAGSADAVVVALQRAKTSDEVLGLLCELGSRHFPFAAVFTVQQGIARARVARGPAGVVDGTVIAETRVDLAAASSFRTAVMGQAPYLGRLDDEPTATQALAMLGRPANLVGALLPVLLGQRVVALLAVDGGGATVMAAQVSDLTSTLGEVAVALRRLIREQKALGLRKAEVPLPDDPIVQPTLRPAPPSTLPEQLRKRPAATHEARPVRPTNPGFPAPLSEAGTPASLFDAVERGSRTVEDAAAELAALGGAGLQALLHRLPSRVHPAASATTLDAGELPTCAAVSPLLALAQRLGPPAVDALVESLDAPSPELRFAAVIAIAELGAPETPLFLARALLDGDPLVRRAARQALMPASPTGDLGRVLERLRERLAAGDAALALAAAEGAGALRDTQAVPLLIPLLGHGDGAVVKAALVALTQITKQDFGNSRWRWRWWWDGNRDRPRVEWLLAGLEHRAAAIRESAEAELAAIGEPRFGFLKALSAREREEARRRFAAWRRDRSAAHDGPGRPPAVGAPTVQDFAEGPTKR